MGLDDLLENQLGHWPKCQKLHIYPFSTPGGRNWAYFCSTGSTFRDTGRFSKLPYLGMKLSKWSKFQKLHIYLLSTPRGQNWACFSPTGSGFQDMGQFSKLPYLGMKLGHQPSSRSCTYSLFLLQGVEIELNFALWAAVSEIQADFQNHHIWEWNLASGQNSRSCTYTSFLPQGGEIELTEKNRKKARACIFFECSQARP